MGKFKFINQKEQIITLYQEGKQYIDIARLLGSKNIENDSQSIRRLIIHTLGNITSNRKIVMTPDIKNQVLNYLNMGKTVPEIANILNINKVTIGSFLSLKGIKLNPNKGNVHYFDSINSYAKAYIVGFIAADGALVKHNNSTSLTITIKYEDKAVLEFIKSEIGNEHKLQEITRPSSFNKSKTIHHIRYCISDKNINQALNKLGITSNKSLSIGNIINNIPYEYRDAFIIGYFDGDGSVTIREGQYHKKGTNHLYPDHSLYIQIRGTKEFLTGICNHLNISVSHIHQNDSIPHLSFANKKDTYRFFQCYKNLPFYYERKYNKFLQRINHPSYDKYKQVQTISSSTE